MNKFEKKSSVLATRCQLAGGLQGNKFKHVASLGHTILRARGQGWEVLYRGRGVSEPRPGCPYTGRGHGWGVPYRVGQAWARVGRVPVWCGSMHHGYWSHRDLCGPIHTTKNIPFPKLGWQAVNIGIPNTAQVNKKSINLAL